MLCQSTKEATKQGLPFWLLTCLPPTQLTTLYSSWLAKMTPSSQGNISHGLTRPSCTSRRTTTSLLTKLFQPLTSPGQLPKKYTARMAFNLVPVCLKILTNRLLFSSKICHAHQLGNTIEPKISGRGSKRGYIRFPPRLWWIKLRILLMPSTKCTSMAPPTWRPHSKQILSFQKATSTKFLLKLVAVYQW